MLLQCPIVWTGFLIIDVVAEPFSPLVWKLMNILLRVIIKIKYGLVILSVESSQVIDKFSVWLYFRDRKSVV